MEIDASIRDGMDHVRMLTDTIGKRPTGFAGERRAAQYLAEQLESWGLEQVATEPFAAQSWDFEVCRLESTLGPMEALPIEFTGATPPGGIEAELLVCESPADAEAGELAGKIVLVNGGLPADEVLLEGEPAGVILVAPDRSWAWHQIYSSQKPLAGKLPMVTLGFADAVDLLRHEVRRLKLVSEPTIEEVEGLNVVGTLPASSGKQERRLNISAHYDSVPAGGSAADNATGTACALEVVHALAQPPLDVAVDVVLFSAEEIGLHGAEAYARQHAAELARTELGIYFDGQGDFLGRHNLHIMGQAGLVDYVRDQLGAIQYRANLNHNFTGLDNAFLSACGVPTLWFQRGPQLTWHTRHDASEDVSPRAMRESIGAAAHLARDVATHPGRFPGGIPDDQMQQLREYVAKGVPAW